MNYRLIDVVLIVLHIRSISLLFAQLPTYNDRTNLVAEETEPPTPMTYTCDNTLVPCGCSYNDVELTPSRIVGGEQAIPNSWSMMVSLRVASSGRHFCGGSILSDSYILTAAHCVDTDLPSDVIVAAGMHNKSDENAVIRQVDHIFVHPSWSAIQNLNDIAILRLSEPLGLDSNRFLSRTCIPHVHWPTDIQNYPSSDIRLAAIGWGRTRDGDSSSSPDNLHQVQVFSIDNDDPDCDGAMYNKEVQFCAGIPDGGKDTCQGDSGGPIFQWLGNRWEQVGITSFGRGCAVAGNPGVYTRLAYYHHWVRSIVMDNDVRPPVTYTCDNSQVYCGCGYKNVELTPSRIVGGEEAVPYSWSFMVSLQHRSSNSHFCGGSIFSDSYILTAAHCVDDETPDRIQIVAGVHNRSDPNGVIREVDHIHVHPGWSSSSSERRHDIAMLHLSQPLRLASNQLLSRICVPKVESPNNVETYPSNGTRLAAIGWGNIKQSWLDNSPDNLHQVQVFTIDNNDPICNKSLYDTQVQFCAALYEGGKDTCQGDSGGPILQWLDNRWEQVGITSFGKGCAIEGDPGIYTRLAYYYDWMESIANTVSTTSTPIPHVVYQCDRTSTCGCGQSDVALLPSRIVGGEDAIEASWSMIVSLLYPGTSHRCGGTLLSESFILTAAHCVDTLSIGNGRNITVAVGMTNRSDPRQIIREVDRIYIHPNYSSQARDFRNDIALLHVKTPIVYTNNPRLAKSCVHRIDPPALTIQHPRNGSRLAVIGWGILQSSDFVLPDMLQQVQVFTIDNNHPTCVDSINDPQLQFCAGIIEGGKG
ncbi:unnamed protein product [Rotaria sp. Silwood2]|nr:unnamed protein product [Rotaria sp. Silwood2]CAF4339304.1 unnamed protein product [Rotaria sp. Silwood2]